MATRRSAAGSRKTPDAKPTKQQAQPREATSAGVRKKPTPAEVTEQLLRPAPDPEAALPPDIEAFLTEYMRNGGNGTAAWRAAHPNYSPGAAAVQAHRVLRNPKVRARLEQERRRIAQKHEMDRDALLAELVAIIRADTNELMQMRRVACASCWSDQASDDEEECKGRPHWLEPDPDCEACGGEGWPQPWFADTRTLSPEGRALYAGVRQTKEGLQILTHSKLDAIEKAARILGAYELDNKQKGDSLADALVRFATQLHSSGVARVQPVPPKPRESKQP